MAIIEGGAMSQDKISVCYFPTKIVFIDDNKSYLDSMRLLFSEKTGTYRFFDSPYNALSFFVNDYEVDSFVDRCIKHEEEDELGHHLLNIEIIKIKDEINIAKRFEQVSVVVIDYAMPGMNGADLSKKLKKFPFKIILLTGEADHNHAVNLFNEGVIQYFIRKDDLNATNLLKNAIIRLQQEYFAEISKIILDSLTQKPLADGLIPSCLSDPVFVDFFNKFIKEQGICEYYLIDESGSFMFLNEKGDITWLIVQNEGEMDATKYEADNDSHISDDLRQKIDNKELLCHYFNEDEPNPQSPEDWKKLLYPATKLLIGDNTYYYSYIKKPQTKPSINPSKILSYSDYLDNLHK